MFRFRKHAKRKAEQNVQAIYIIYAKRKEEQNVQAIYIIYTYNIYICICIYHIMNLVKVKVVTPWTVQSMEFSKPEY